LLVTFWQLGEGAENRSRNLEFSTSVSKTAWCCELTIFTATNQAVFATYEAVKFNLSRTPLFCQTAR